MSKKINSYVGTDVVFTYAHGADELTLNDLSTAVSAAAKQDARFNVNGDGTTRLDYYPWCNDVLRDEDEDLWSAVIQAADGSYYKVPFTINADNGAVTLGAEAVKVSRRTVYVAAKCCYNGVPFEVKAVGSSDGATKGNATKKTSSADAASKMAHDATAKAHATEQDGDHAAAKDAHAIASDAHKKAMMAHSKAGNADKASEHAKAMVAHDAYGEKHAPSDEPDDDEAVKATGFFNCRDVGTILATEAKWEFGKEVALQWMPGGVHNIVAGTELPSQSTRPVDLWIECNEKTAQYVKASFDRAVKASPRRRPFGCIEHHEEEKAFEPVGFEWKNEPEPGVYCTAKPTKLGETNVNGRLHTSFSPVFGSNADYSKAKCEDCEQLVLGKDACSCGGTIYFPKGVLGSQDKPAQVVAVSPKSVGSLTNWPAFKNILPIAAKDQSKDGKVPADKKNEPLTVDKVMAKLAARRTQTQDVLATVHAKQFPAPKENETPAEILARLSRKKGQPAARK